MIAALFVLADGPYAVPGFDVWDCRRDARLYGGPYPVIAHPPCARWGRYWFGGPSARVRRLKGDDGGCFAAALAAVRRWGGVLEHPADSHAWPAFGLAKPPRDGGWVMADPEGGWTCCVEQGHYGHLARKATWLYAVRTGRPELRWGASDAVGRLDAGFHSAEARRQARAAGRLSPPRLTKRQQEVTPVPFRDLLRSLVESGRGEGHAHER